MKTSDATVLPRGSKGNPAETAPRISKWVFGVVDVTVSYARGMLPMYWRPAIADQDYVDELGRTVVYGRRRAEAPELGPLEEGTNVFSHQACPEA